MNMLHTLSEPIWLVIVIMTVAVSALSVLVMFAATEKDDDEYWREVDHLQTIIERRNKERRIKAEHDEHG